ncbi:MAG: nuclear transport factor 2 family protein [Oscillospiraceae bacterium]|nr:nuclear transport factor 2 family protein [Oscillospiraceae bacterium]
MLFLKPGPNTVQTVIDKYSIKELIEYERFCRDNAQWEEMRRCFMSDSRVTVSWFNGSGSEFVDASIKAEGYAPHKLYNTVIDLRGDKAVALTMAMISKRSTLDGATFDVQVGLRLLFCVQKISGLWLIKSMDGIYEKDNLIPFVGYSFAIPEEETKKFRPSYACLSWVLDKEGYTINKDLPGIDRPETIEKLYREAENWVDK